MVAYRSADDERSAGGGGPPSAIGWDQPAARHRLDDLLGLARPARPPPLPHSWFPVTWSVRVASKTTNDHLNKYSCVNILLIEKPHKLPSQRVIVVNKIVFVILTFFVLHVRRVGPTRLKSSQFARSKACQPPLDSNLRFFIMGRIRPEQVTRPYLVHSPPQNILETIEMNQTQERAMDLFD